ncbi:hypothetical protein H8E77_38300, partial [bacterium]|nr:hypothetical protein [bacterium]
MRFLFLVLLVASFVFLISSVEQAMKDESLVLYFPFDEGTGNTTKDLNGNENHGTINGAKWLNGKVGEALSFDGSDSVRVADFDIKHSKKMQSGGGKETNIDKTNRSKKMETVRDRLWLWGHPAGSHNHLYGLVKESHITPADAAAYMGIRNVLVVRYGPNPYNLYPKPPFAEWAKPLATIDRVMWSIEGGGGGDVDEALKLMNV